MQELYNRLLHDLKAVGIDIDFTLELKPYSKSYFGRYNPASNKVTLYVYKDSRCEEKYSYKELFLTLIHEVCHCIQWKDKSFVRVKGVMHDVEFWKMYDLYSDRAKAYVLLKEVKRDNFFTKIGGQVFDFCYQYG